MVLAPKDVLELKKDVSFALRRGTIAQVPTHEAFWRDATLAGPCYGGYASALPRMRLLLSLNRRAAPPTAGAVAECQAPLNPTEDLGCKFTATSRWDSTTR
jgi:hypothetical protein